MASMQKRRGSLDSAIETFLLALRKSELDYVVAVSGAGCGSAKPFGVALRVGSGCTGASVTVFSQSVQGSSDIAASGAEAIYKYISGGCEIQQNVSTCLTNRDPFLEVSFANTSYRFQIAEGFDSAPSGYLEFVVVEKRDGAPPTTATFAVREGLSGSLHLEPSGRVVNSNPDPGSPCPGQAWSEALIYQPATRTCLAFEQAGGGYGLFEYNRRYFGLRPVDGRIAALSQAATGVLVDPNGTLEGIPLIPPYPDPSTPEKSLLGIDDLTTIDRSYYYVRGQGLSAEVGVIDPSRTNGLRPLCQLGQMGWSQAYSGIAASSTSDPLFNAALPVSQALATLFLKTDSGDLLTLKVIGTGCESGTCTGAPQCFVFKDADTQEIEFTRTLGFERSPDERPYFIY
jgi:hypothetical protein